MGMRVVWAAFALLMFWPAVAPAETRCQPRPAATQAFRSGLDLAIKTREALQRSGASVVLLARVGQDLSEHGLRYSHMGIAAYDADAARWQVTHLLNECGTARSALYQEGLANFFMDDLHEFETLVIVPRNDVQLALTDALKSGLHVAMHDPAYSTIAYPYSTRYQNCNQWVLELVVGSAAQPGLRRDRRSAQQWLTQSAYRPSVIRISAGERLGARLFSTNVRFDDHPSNSVPAERYQVVSVESVVSFLRESGMTAGEQIVRLTQ